MDDLEVLRHQMFTRVRNFGASHAASFQPSSTGGKLFAVLNGIIDELDGHAAAQRSGDGAVRQSTSIKALIREELLEELSAISRTARSISVEKPGIVDKFRLPRSGNDQLLLNAARAFASDAAEFANDFVQYEMPADFLEKLKSDIVLFDQAVIGQHSGLETRVTATAAIDDVIERGMKTVRRLDAIVRNKFREDPVTLAVWVSASHKEQPPRPGVSKKKTDPVVPSTS